jgi:hypothetical protein
MHTTIGVYANGSFKMNGVKPEHLEEHIKYNLTNRFGRALFIDGKCHYKGYLSEADAKNWEEKIASDPQKFTATRITIPYQ